MKLAIEAFVKLGMVNDDGFLSITGWEEHQDSEGLDKIREYNRIAKQRSREKQKEKQKQLQGVTNVNDMSMTSDGQNLDPSISISISNSISKDSEDRDRGTGEEEETKKSGVKTEKPRKTNVFEEASDGDQELLEALQDFEKMRNQMKKPMSERARKMLINKLAKEFPREQWVEVLEQSIFHGWDSVWPLKSGGNENGTGKNQYGRYREAGGTSQGTGKDFSDLRPSLDPDDESTWGA